MFHLSIAVGGALGSMARAWLAIVVACIAGPAFPWGTIAISVIGSSPSGSLAR
jgi:fluoride exporter